ncbi:unnamed protein product [Parnassius apollo]|uniref:(apollo) hypothetical protein n=1 Tax=Parnassius apollo TaxID=110799 RepID=A0A8S3WHS1_PARAO|nr:unnamed protein product [Parnassius apollo]
MDLSTSTLSHFMPYWLDGLLEECDNEAKDHMVYPIKLLQRESRAAVWNLCSHFCVDQCGVPALACRLLERYLSVLHRHHILLRNGSEEWHTFKMKLTEKMPLLIATCIQLAAKMGSVKAKLNANIIRVGLLCKGANYSIRNINDTEFEVYRTLEYRIPFWTSVDAGLFLAFELGMPIDKLHKVATMVDFAEFLRDCIEKKVQLVANLSPTSRNTSNMRTLHLVAGAVSAIFRFLHLDELGCTGRLAKLTRAPFSYIKCISDIICAEIVTDNKPPIKRTHKRKYPQ